MLCFLTIHGDLNTKQVCSNSVPQPERSVLALWPLGFSACTRYSNPDGRRKSIPYEAIKCAQKPNLRLGISIKAINIGTATELMLLKLSTTEYWNWNLSSYYFSMKSAKGELILIWRVEGVPFASGNVTLSIRLKEQSLPCGGWEEENFLPTERIYRCQSQHAIKYKGFTPQAVSPG